VKNTTADDPLILIGVKSEIDIEEDITKHDDMQKNP